MQARIRCIVILLLALPTWLYGPYPAHAQYTHYRANRCARILSVTADASGHFLLLNVQKRAFPAPPVIHYLQAPAGQTLMVADFADLLWTSEPRVLKPDNALITSVRLGQFQESPPVFRISIAATEQNCLKNLEFRCQPRSLVIKFPTAKESALSAAVAESRPARTEATPDKKLACKTLISQTSPPVRPVSLSSALLPFRPGGLYLALGPDPKNKKDPPQTEVLTPPETRIQTVEAKSATAKKENDNVLPPAAPERTSPVRREIMPAPAPPPGRTNETQPADVQEKKEPAARGLAGRLKKLFCRQNFKETPEIAPKDIPAAAQADNNAAGLATAGSADRDKLPEAAPANPQVEFCGKSPLTVKLKFDADFKYKTFKLDDPPRFVIDVDNLPPHINPQSEPTSNPWLKAVRIGSFENRIMRIVLDLTQTHVDVQEERRHNDLVLTLGNEPGGTVSLSQRQVVLDAGHGGSDPGAQRGDIQEKEITLAITQKVKHYLQEHGIKVVMTRQDDSFVSLEDRRRISNERHADAFVSIHINSLESDRDIQGIETYYQTEQSRALADRVHAQLVEGLKVPDRQVRKARFYVVNHTDRPAILAEVGFISNKNERDKLISSDYQSKIAESLGQGVILFLGTSCQTANTVLSTPKVSQATPRVSASKRTGSALASNEQSALKQ